MKEGTDTGHTPTAGRGLLDIKVLAAIIVLVSGTFGFVLFLAMARHETAYGIDSRILLAFRQKGQPGIPIGPTWLEEFLRDITALGSSGVITLVMAAACGFLIVARRDTTAIFVWIAISGGQVLTSQLKGVVARPRPELISHLVDESSTSFPSGHAMMSAVTYLTLGILVARIVPNGAQRAFVIAATILLTILIGISRLYLGVHWPTDVFAGWSAGVAWAALFWLAARLASSRRKTTLDS